MEYNGTYYWFGRNLQGDILRIYDGQGNVVVSYTYNAWGEILSASGSGAATVGAANPFRYRGYYYDSESGFYYLNSRYYDPLACRFLNADSVMGISNNVTSYNLFAYCFNNSIMLIDPNGTCPYNGTAADFHRLEYGLPSLDCNCIDLTEKLNTFMDENVKKLKEYQANHGPIKTIEYFYRNVTDGGELDIKLQDEWKFEEGKKYIYKCKELRYDDPGNINFGYVGAIIFPETILCFGAGVNQIKKYGFKFGDFSTFFDDPRDNKMIKYGYSLYKEKYR